jgi:hypothetical protein
LTVTATDDGVIRTHDDASAVLRYAVSGAHVAIWKTPTGTDATRSYEVSISRHGRPLIAVRGAYTCGQLFADELARQVVTEVAKRAAG